MSPLKIVREAMRFALHLYEKKYLIYELTKRDFKAKYSENWLGIAWAVIDPLATMLIFWLVFGIGLRAGRQMGIPFVAYLITGIVSYGFFQSAMSQATNSLQSYSFLLKKVDFRTSILPLVRVLSELFLHGIVLSVTALIIIGNDVYPTLFWFQVVYYVFGTCLLVLGLSWITSSVNLFFPDINNIIQIIIRFFFFLTPIFWDAEMFPDKVVKILKLNPMFYIVEGYRNSLLFERPFWINWHYGIYFWSVVTVSILLGVVVFARLRPHFADVV